MTRAIQAQVDADMAAIRAGQPTDAARRRKQLLDEDVARVLSVRRPPVRRPTSPALPPADSDRPPPRRFLHRSTPNKPTAMPPKRLTEAQRLALGCCEHVAAWRATLPFGDR